MCCRTTSGSVCGAIFLLTMAYLCQLFSFVSPFWEQHGHNMEGLWIKCNGGQCDKSIKSLDKLGAWHISLLALQTAATGLLNLTMFISCCLACRSCRSSCGFILAAFLAILAALCIGTSLGIYGTGQVQPVELKNLWIGYWVGVPAAVLALFSSCILYRANSIHDAEEIF